MHTLTIHRSTIRNNLITYFKDGSKPHNKRLEFIVLDPRGKPEEGVGIGMSRYV